LGRSLGVDLVPFKTCTYDCIYCQLGRTTHKTVERAEYVPLKAVVAEVKARLAQGPAPDYVTLSGSGEPTLHLRVAELISEIKAFTTTPVAVLTNGSLLWQAEVRESLAEADLVVPSLDAGSEALFQRVNRPHPEITFERMVTGLQEFRPGFAKPIWLEVFLLEGLTALPAEVERIAEIVTTISPDRVQLNSVARPPAEEYARGVPLETLRACAKALGPQAEIVMDYEAAAQPERSHANEAEIRALLQRRPCRVEDIAAGLGLHRNEVLKHLGHLLRAGQVTGAVAHGSTYYSAAGTDDGPDGEELR
jgi:wyosine [tRNA(Phe)-imidazoG37] synthetase (radical SAM superfamily)